MRYMALATDYDGTIASGGRVTEDVIRSLENVKGSGRKLLLVTGRHLEDLRTVFPAFQLFDRIIAENGALLYDPASREEKVLAEAPSEEFLSALRNAGVPFDVGRAIISSWTPSETKILNVIQRLALDHQVIFNKGAVMVLPSGINKATGLRCALESLQLSPHNTVAVGDGENDHAFLSACECGVAVANAVPALRERADVVTEGDHGQGVMELIDRLLKDDLKSYDAQVLRSTISIGEEKHTGTGVRIVPNRNSVLVAGKSASGKSTAVAGILEALAEKEYQFCLIDPEGDFEHFAGALTIGGPSDRPTPSTVAKALESSRSLIVNLMGFTLKERPEAFTALLANILEIRAKTARPHWLVVDEAHHLMPVSWSPSSTTMPRELGGAILITVHPEHLSPAALAFVDLVIATGDAAPDTLHAFAQAIQLPSPPSPSPVPSTGEALVWHANGQEHTILIKTRMAKSERRRHRRNYAEGELSPEQSFYFRGPHAKLNLRAQNLMTFVQLSDGVDDETWLYHLRQGDYSRWFERVIKDDELTRCVKRIEQGDPQDPGEGRAQLKQAIDSRYTAPA